MPHSDPYHSWSGAPKHWTEIPVQRQAPPPVVRSAVPPAGAARRQVIAVSVGFAIVAATVVVLATDGQGSSVADNEPRSATTTTP